MKKTTITYFALIVLLAATFYFALTHGASQVSFTNLTNTQLNVLFNIRLPRIFSDLVAGAALSVSGAFFQASLRNPIADPGFMGVSAGASLFEIVFALIFPSLFLGKIFFAILGGCFTFLLLVQFQSRMNPYKLIIVGVALDAIYSGLISVIAPEKNAGMSLATSTWTTTICLGIIGIIGIIGALFLSSWANYLKVNDEELSSLGLSAQKMRLILLLLATILASAVTANVGVLAFIGIIVPHQGRFLVGHDYDKLIPFSIIAGSWFLLFVDTVGRTIIAPDEISANVLLAIIGGPVLIAILVKENRGKSYD